MKTGYLNCPKHGITKSTYINNVELCEKCYIESLNKEIQEVKTIEQTSETPNNETQINEGEN